MTTRVDTTAEVNVLELDGKDATRGAFVVTVKTHWNNEDLVNLVIERGGRYTVSAADLQLAIKRCSR